MLARSLAFAIAIALFAACGSNVGGTGPTGTGSATSTGAATTSGSGTTSTAASGAGGATGGATGAGGAGVGGGCAVDPTFAMVLAKPLSGCSGHEPPCHNGSAAMLHIDPLDPAGTWAALVNVKSYTAGAGKRVVPGDPKHSFLYRKLVDDLTANEGAAMPASGLAIGWKELAPDEIEMVRCWILAGAKKN